jgi:hypothetical protein
MELWRKRPTLEILACNAQCAANGCGYTARMSKVMLFRGSTDRAKMMQVITTHTTRRYVMNVVKLNALTENESQLT